MMKILKPLLLVILFLLNIQKLNAEIPHFVDFKYILNESVAGKKAQDYLKSKLNNGIKKLKDQKIKLQKEEKKIIQQKKLISPEEYKKKVTELRNKVSSLQKNRNNLLESVSKERSKARGELLKNLNPILKDYMKEKNIRMIVDKKSILLADENLDLTDEIIKILNKKLKSINLD